MLFYRFCVKSSQKIWLIRGDSHDTAAGDKVQALFMGNPIDLLFSDVDHTYEGVKRF